MRLAYFCAQSLGETPRARVWQLARRMARRGHRATLFSPGRAFKTRTREIEGVAIVEAPGSPLQPDYLLYAVAPFFLGREFSRRGPFDLVHAFQAPLPASGAAALKAAAGIPLVVDWEEDYGDAAAGRAAGVPAFLLSRTAALERKGAAAARALVVVSEALAERARQLGVPAERTHRIGNGADVSAPVPDRAACRKALGLPVEATILACDAGDSSALGLLAGALRDLRPAHSGLLLVLVGEPRPGGAPQEARAALPGAVHVAGPLDAAKRREAWGAADLALLPREDTPAERARFPLAFGEFLAAGRAVVASDVGEVGRLLRERLCGVLAQNQEQFNRRIEELVQNAERRARLEQLARHTAETILNWECHADALAALYAELVLARKP